MKPVPPEVSLPGRPPVPPVPGRPPAPSVPSVPGVPAVPAVPGVPAIPRVPLPAAPVVQRVPVAPGIPAAPAEPSSSAGSFMDDILASVSKKTIPQSGIPDCPIAPRELPPGTSLHGYRLERSLGAGGFGVTYLAVDEQLNRKVVIKENFPDRLCVREAGTLNVLLVDKEQRHDYPLVLANFLRELRVLSSLEHPNLARIYSCFEAHYTVYYITEFIRGMSLGDLAEDYAAHGRHIPQEGLYCLMVRLLDALHYLHSKRFLHCDIKPDNILINHRGVPVIIDFGAALSLDAPAPVHMVETPGFTPSEQLAGKGGMGPWTDLYALGATFYYILAEDVLPPCSQRELVDSVVPLARRPELCELYNPRLLASIDRAIRPLAWQRYQSAADWLADLRGW